MAVWGHLSSVRALGGYSRLAKTLLHVALLPSVTVPPLLLQSGGEPKLLFLLLMQAPCM